jgi:FkbM family methyltransferase
MLRSYVKFREWLGSWPWKETNVVDVGACVGSFTLAAAEMLEGAKLSAFEPWPDALLWLEQNLRSQNAMHCRLHRMAASNQAGQVWMTEGPRWGMSSLHGEGAGLMVEAARLDDVVRSPVSLMKLDVEGHEWEVLSGAMTIIERDHPRLIIEMRKDLLVKAGHTPEDVTDFLYERGYGYQLALTKQDYLFSTEKEIAKWAAM